MMRLSRIGITLVALLLAASGCGSAPPQVPPSAGNQSPNEPQAAEVLSFEAPNLAGGVLRGADFVGKDVALWFWAPW
jgi:hypothetical protein